MKFNFLFLIMFISGISLSSRPSIAEADISEIYRLLSLINTDLSRNSLEYSQEDVKKIEEQMSIVLELVKNPTTGELSFKNSLY